jgi:hypothetical protein
MNRADLYNPVVPKYIFLRTPLWYICNIEDPPPKKKKSIVFRHKQSYRNTPQALIFSSVTISPNTCSLILTISRGFVNTTCLVSYLVKTKEAQILDNTPSSDLLPGGYLARHLQSDLDYLQRVCEHYLTPSSLEQTLI